MSTATSTVVAPAISDLILDHTNRYRLTVPPALFRLRDLRQIGRKQIRAILRRMCREHQLAWATLYGNHRYYYVPSAQRSTRSQSVARLGPLSGAPRKT